jgi:hypothetical protein
VVALFFQKGGGGSPVKPFCLGFSFICGYVVIRQISCA